MQANRSLPQTAHNGQSLKAAQFVTAFDISPNLQPNITMKWSSQASEAITALVDFRSTIHRWLASGSINEAEFVAEVDRLESCGLGAFVDELIGEATALACRGGAL